LKNEVFAMKTRLMMVAVLVSATAFGADMAPEIPFDSVANFL
jgi:hypothetical protein